MSTETEAALIILVAVALYALILCGITVAVLFSALAEDRAEARECSAEREEAAA